MSLVYSKTRVTISNLDDSRAIPSAWRTSPPSIETVKMRSMIARKRGSILSESAPELGRVDGSVVEAKATRWSMYLSMAFETIVSTYSSDPSSFRSASKDAQRAVQRIKRHHIDQDNNRPCSQRERPFRAPG